MKKYFDLLRNYPITFLFPSLLKEVRRVFWREMIKGSFAQNYEDIQIEKLFPNNYQGSYLEIGAYHPTRLSNTYRFYKKGWRGTVIEPNLEVKTLFNKIRPEDKFFGLGISDKNQKLNYYQFFIPALNTFSKTEADKNITNGHRLQNITKITTQNISGMIKEDFDFVSIDTEGFDYQILKNWPWKKCKPKVICVETDKMNVEKLLRTKGYRLIFENRHNSIFWQQ